MFEVSVVAYIRIRIRIRESFSPRTIIVNGLRDRYATEAHLSFTYHARRIREVRILMH